MPVERNRFRNGIKIVEHRRWNCPRCQNGRLQLDKRSLSQKETAKSSKAHSHEDWDPEWVVELFHAFLVCDNVSCGECACVAGIVRYSFDPASSYEQSTEVWTPYYFIRYMQPPQRLIEVSAGTPENIKKTLEEAFALFWGDMAACMNRLRAVVELILDALKISKWVRSKGRLRRRLVHDRIEILSGKQKHASAAELLKAVKWLGNAGSHSEVTALTEDDVFDAFDLLERILIAVFDPQSRSLDEIAAVINKKRGPLGNSRLHKRIPRKTLGKNGKALQKHGATQG